MGRFNAMQETYMEVEVLGKPALFTSIRLDYESVPDNLYIYEVRHDDDGGADPVQIAKRILVNHFGTIIMAEEISLPADGYLDIEPEDVNFACGDCRTVAEFLKKFIPKK